MIWNFYFVLFDCAVKDEEEKIMEMIKLVRFDEEKWFFLLIIRSTHGVYCVMTNCTVSEGKADEKIPSEFGGKIGFGNWGKKIFLQLKWRKGNFIFF